MSIQLKLKDGMITAHIPAGNQAPDNITIFHDNIVNGITELLDKYGNHQWILKDGKPVISPQQPTEEQLAAYRKKRIVEEVRKRYSADDEFAILIRGDRTEHEEYVVYVKKLVNLEIKKDLEVIDGSTQQSVSDNL